MCAFACNPFYFIFSYKIYVVSTENEEQGRKLLSLQNQNLGIYFLMQVANSTSIAVSPQSSDAFNIFLRENDYDFQIISENLERYSLYIL